MTAVLFYDEIGTATPGVYEMRTSAVDYADGTRGIVAFPFGPDWENGMTSSIGSGNVELSQADIDYLRSGGRRIYR